MKTIIAGCFLGVVALFGFIGFEKFNSYPVFFDKNGQLTANQVRVWGDTVVPTTANGYSINVSSAGFSTIKDVTITPQMNTATVGSMPIVVIKTVSTTAVVVNILTQNSAVVSILGINVLSGAPLQFAASTTGIVLHVKCVGY